MRSPSSRILSDCVTLQRANPGSDTDGGITQAPTVLAWDVPCSVQPGEPARDVQTFERFGPTIPWDCFFDSNPGLNIGDFISWTEDASFPMSAVHSLVVTGTANQGGTNAAWVISTIERV